MQENTIKLYDIILYGNKTIEITEEKAKQLKEIISNVDSVEIEDVWLKTSTILAIMPSNKNHSKYKSFQNFIQNSQRKISFEDYLDAINYPRTISNIKHIK